MDHTQRVINYYEATHIDYRVLWAGSGNRALHFGYYDERAKNHRASLARMNEILAEAVHISGSDRILDAGCGYGGSAMWLAATYGCPVDGVTLTPLHAQKAERYVKERGLEEKVKIFEGDFTELPFTEKSYDVYWAHESLVHASNLDVVLKEAARLLKPGGRIVIAEYTLRESPPLDDSEREYIKPWLGGWAMPKLLTRGEYTQALEKAGFTDIHMRDVTENVRPSLRRLEILSVLNYPIALFIAPFFFRKERLENYYASWRQIKALKKGLWAYSIIVAERS